MKKLKKLLSILLVCATLLPLTGCGEKNVEGTLNEIIEKIYADIPSEEMPMIENLDVLKMVPGNLTYYIGTEDIEYEAVLASEPMMSSIAYSVVLVRMKDGADIEAAKKEIKENVNPRKWGCVEVPEEDVIVKSKGDLIILIMVADENTRNKIEEGFDNL